MKLPITLLVLSAVTAFGGLIEPEVYNPNSALKPRQVKVNEASIGVEVGQEDTSAQGPRFTWCHLELTNRFPITAFAAELTAACTVLSSPSLGYISSLSTRSVTRRYNGRTIKYGIRSIRPQPTIIRWGVPFCEQEMRHIIGRCTVGEMGTFSSGWTNSTDATTTAFLEIFA